MLVATLTRASTGEETQPHSIDAQRTRLAAYITSQPDWQHVAEYTDRMSGATLDRPGLQQALADARAGRYELLPVYRVDRLARSVRGLAEILDALHQAGVGFRSATEPFDTTTPAGRMMVQMLRGLRRARTRHHHRPCHRRHGTQSRGRRLDRRHLPVRLHRREDPRHRQGHRQAPAQRHAPLVPLIFHLDTRRRLRSAAIAARLNQHGHHTRTGRPWSPTTVRRVLRNRAYPGEVSFRGHRYHADHHPLTTPDVYDTAQALLAERGDDHPARRSNPSDYLLAGLVRCTRCGKRFIGTAATGNRYRYAYHTCSSRLRYGPTTCNADRLPATELEPAILTTLLDTYQHTSLIHDALQAAADRLASDRHRDQDALDTINAEIGQAEQAIQRYLLAFEAGTLPERVCGDRLRDLGTTAARLRANRDQLIRRLETTPLSAPTGDELAALRARTRAVVANGSIPARKALLRALVHEIRVDARDHIQPVFRVPCQAPPAP